MERQRLEADQPDGCPAGPLGRHPLPLIFTPARMEKKPPRMQRFILVAAAVMLLPFGSLAQDSRTLPVPSDLHAKAATSPAAEGKGEFMAAADQVLSDMSGLLDLPVKQPLKKSLRTREQIREYLVREQAEDRTPNERYAEERALEAFGLIPKGFPLDSFLLDLLTDQVAGLYDPKTQEFYIADWIDVADQKSVMAHELTHALDDQYFHIDAWSKAARPDDDAEFARDSVIEGSALAAMIDYMLREQKMSVRDLPDLGALMQASVDEQVKKEEMLAKAPLFLRDSLLFPYLTGAVFTQQFLKAKSGWSDFHEVFENPPASSQQIMHPELYLTGVKPLPVALPKFETAALAGYAPLYENVLGEFGLNELLKQFLGADVANRVSPGWAGDRYGVLESADKKRLKLVFVLRLDGESDATQLFSAYSSLLVKKYSGRLSELLDGQYAELGADNDSAFLRCVASECLVLEGGGRAEFENFTGEMGWKPLAAKKSAGARPPERSNECASLLEAR
jgi:hypothetical protein